MSEYTVKQSSQVPAGANDTNEWWQVFDPLGNVVSGAQYQYMAHRVANDLNAGTKALRQEIASLQEANADLLAAAEARSEELGKARNFIRELAMASAAHHIWDYIVRAREMQAQWEAQEVEADKPKFKVGDKVRIIEDTDPLAEGNTFVSEINADGKYRLRYGEYEGTAFFYEYELEEAAQAQSAEGE